MAFAFEGSGSTYLDDIKKPKNITIGIINEHRFKFMYSFSWQITGITSWKCEM